MYALMLLAARVVPESACTADDVAEFIATDRVVREALYRPYPGEDRAYAERVNEKLWNLTMQSYQVAANDSEFSRFYRALTWVEADLEHALVLYDEPGAYPASARHTWYLERCYLSD